MNYKAFYRTYRPIKFDEVVGQDHIVKTLVNIIKTNKISHGYLFSGPRGTGKTSVAKIFANAINCIHSEKPEEICKHCLDTRNTSLDVVEIDAASNNGVNDIRTLREQVDFAPTNHPYKVYIIDEVHMLSKGAFNALLMTLEEPPAHAIFILATTDPEKIPETILSRLQRYNFKRITKNDLVHQLKFIFDKEQIKYDEESLDMISTLANGSLRDALSIADQINAYSNSNINKKNIIEIFGLSTIETQIKLLNLMTSKNVSQALQYFDELVASGIDISKLIISLISLLKDYLIYKKTMNSSLIETTNEEMLLKINAKSDNVYKILDIFLPLLNEIKYSDIPQQLTQLAIIKICSLEGQIDDFVNKNSIKSISINENHSHNKNNDINAVKEENIKNNIKDVTNDFFTNQNEEAIIIKAPETQKAKTLEKTILTDYDKDSIADRFNFLHEEIKEKIENVNEQNSSDSNLLNQNILVEKNIENNSVNNQTKTNLNLKETETFSFENAHTDEVIENTTNILNLDNEEIVEGIEMSESLINPVSSTDKTKLYDTNEISLESNNYSLNDKLPLETKTQFIENINDETTKEFVLNDENLNNTNTNINAITEEKYVLTQPNIVNLFILANRATFDIFKDKLNKAGFAQEEKYEAYSMLFKELKFICSSNDYILVSAKEDWIINDLIQHKNSQNFRNFIAKYFGDNVHFFSITRKEYETSRELFVELKKNNNVPKARPLSQISNTSTYNFNDNIYKETENKAKAIFGNIFKRKISEEE